MLAVTGYRTTIVERLRELIKEDVVRIDVGFNYESCDKYLLAAGLLYSKSLLQQTNEEIFDSLRVNLVDTMRACECILTRNKAARVCVIGSESANIGSYDQVYAVAKAGLHAYVRFRRVGNGQSLTCVSPPIISDSGMTKRRHDYPAVLESRRTVTALNVAYAVVDALYNPARYGRNEVISL